MDQQILEAALRGLQLKRAELEAQIEIVHHQMLGKVQRTGKISANASSQPVTVFNNVCLPPKSKPKPKRKISAAGRKRISQAQKARWDKLKAAKGNKAKAAKE